MPPPLRTAEVPQPRSRTEALQNYTRIALGVGTELLLVDPTARGHKEWEQGQRAGPGGLKLDGASEAVYVPGSELGTRQMLAMTVRCSNRD